VRGWGGAVGGGGKEGFVGRVGGGGAGGLACDVGEGGRRVGSGGSGRGGGMARGEWGGGRGEVGGGGARQCPGRPGREGEVRIGGTPALTPGARDRPRGGCQGDENASCALILT